MSSGALALLIIPSILTLTGWHFSWDAFDFLVAAILLSLLVLSVEFFLRKANSTIKKILAVLFVSGVFILIWIELPIGLFGSPFAEK